MKGRRDIKPEELRIIIMGLPGSGKSLQAKKIAEKYSLIHVSTGDALREMMENGSDLGREVQRYMKMGKLFPDSLVNSVLEEKLPSSGFILDGYPRKMSQVETVKNISIVIYLDVPQDIIMKRILGREDDRVDDNAETVKKRIAAFNKETEPLVEHYKRKGVLVEVDASNTPDEVFAEIESNIQQITSHH